ncbi:MAG: SprB repeat-containing protein, partial [Bacteroidota bacterium]|nr:SprB repeat-containing protein [Bacteroidota bacterium]
GLISFTLNTAGNWVVVVRVTQYNAAGQVIGMIMRDMQFVAYPCDNIPPNAASGSVSNLTGTAVQTGPRAVQVCESGNFCFDMVINDANLPNVLTAFSNIQQNLPGATFTYSGSNPITVNVCWTAQAGTSGFFPFIVNVNDGACPIPAFQTYVYSVNVLPGVTATVQATNETCLGSGDGSLSTSVSAGTPPFTYAWSTGANTTSITAPPGVHTVTISDANGCVSQVLSDTIGTAALPNQANAGADATICGDQLPIQLNGSVVNATGGTWGGGSGTFSGIGVSPIYTPSAADFLAGSVQLTLMTTGNPGCPPATDSVTYLIPDNFSSASVNSTDATCWGLSNGSAAFTPTDPGFTYLWNDPLAQTTGTATGLEAGDYSITVTDAAGCSITLPATIGPSAALSIAQISTIDETCLGVGDGSATVNVTGGTAPYTYEWSNGSSIESITDTAGTYSIQITDANGCAPLLIQVTIDAASVPNVAIAGDDEQICIDALPIELSGAVENATDGTWSGGSGQFTGSGVNVTYMPSQAELNNGQVQLTLTTTGNAGCPPASDDIAIQINNSFVDGTVNVTDATCFEQTNGSAAYSPDLPGFTYSWSDPASQNTATATGLGAGTVNVTVTDQFNCSITLPAVIGPPSPIVLMSINAVDESCLNSGNGSATAAVSGGTAPYTYA